MTYNPSRDHHLELHDRDGVNPVLMSVHDDGDAVTFGFDVKGRGTRISMGVQLDAEGIDALVQRLTDIRQVRGW